MYLSGIKLNKEKLLGLCVGLLKWREMYTLPWSAHNAHKHHFVYYLWIKLKCWFWFNNTFWIKSTFSSLFIHVTKRNCFIAFTCNAKNFEIAFLILRLRVTQNALQLPFFFSALFFFSTVFLDGLTKVFCVFSVSYCFRHVWPKPVFQCLTCIHHFNKDYDSLAWVSWFF